MFKRKGIRMSTLEIEAAALDIAGVRAAAVLPPADEHDLALFVEAERARSWNPTRPRSWPPGWSRPRCPPSAG